MGKLVKGIVAIALLALVGGGTAWYMIHTSSLLRIDDFTINPRVEINPERQYRIAVWEHQLPLPWNPNGQTDSFEAAIDEFQSIYPNIHIEVTWLPWDEGQQTLRESLAQGHPPDLYGMPQGVRKMDPTLQIPVGPYMSDEAREDVMEAGLVAASDTQHLWAWPKWILPSIWVAHRDIVPDLEATRKAWDVDRFLDAIRAGKEKTQARGIVLNPWDPSLFVAVMTATTGTQLIGDTGERAWTVENMVAVLDVFHTLVEEGLTDANADRMSRSRLIQFLNEDALMVAPVNPWLYRHLLGRTGAINDHRIIALPPPTLQKERHVYPATISGYVAFRQEAYQGDDHTKAVMLLADHLSRRLGPWEAAQLLAVPAHPTARTFWQEEAHLPETEADFLIHLATHAVGGPIVDAYAHQQHKAIHQIIAEEFPKLWQGVPPHEIAEGIARKIDGVRAEVPFLSQR